MRQTDPAVTPRSKPISLLTRIEILYVNDRSVDGTLGVICDLRPQDPRIAIVDLSHNFGKEIAPAAGLDCARGMPL